MKLSDPPDLFTRDIVSVDPEKPVAEVIALMRGAKPISCVLVKKDERLVGIFTERDVVALVSEKKDFMDRPIRDVMSDNVHTHDIRDSWQIAVDKMCKHNIRRLPVMDNGQVVGILTTTDILNDLHGEVVRAENVFNRALEGFVILRKTTRRRYKKKILRLVAMNDRVQEILKYDATELKRLRFSNVIQSSDDLWTICRAITNAREKGIVSKHKLKLRPRQGKKVRVDVSISRLRFPDGEAGILICGMDTSDHEAIEEQSRLRNLRIESLFGNSPIPMATFNVERLIRKPEPEDHLFGPFAQGMSRLKGVALEPNQAMIEFYGVEHKDEIDVLASLEEEYRKKLEEFAQEWLSDKKQGRLLSDIPLHTSTEVKYVDLHLTPAIDNNYLGILTVIDKTKCTATTHQLENTLRTKKEELHRINQKYEHLINFFMSAPIGIAQCKPDGTFLSVNQRYCEMLGYEQNELMRKKATELHVAPKRREQMVNDLYKSRTKTLTGFKADLRDRMGDIVPTERSIRLVEGRTKDEDYFESFVRDLSAEKELEQTELANQQITNLFDEKENEAHAKDLNAAQLESIYFTNSPIPIWHEDMSCIKDILKDVTRYEDAVAVFDDDENVKSCVRNIHVKQINNAGAKLVDTPRDEILRTRRIPTPNITPHNTESFRKEFLVLAKAYLNNEAECHISEGIDFEYFTPINRTKKATLYLQTQNDNTEQGAFLSNVYVFIVDTTEQEHAKAILNGRHHLVCGSAETLLKSIVDNTRHLLTSSDDPEAKHILDEISIATYCVHGTLPLSKERMKSLSNDGFFVKEPVDLFSLFSRMAKLWQKTIDDFSLTIQKDDKPWAPGLQDIRIECEMPLLCCLGNLLVAMVFGECRSGAETPVLNIFERDGKVHIHMEGPACAAADTTGCPKDDTVREIVTRMGGTYSTSKTTGCIRKVALPSS